MKNRFKIFLLIVISIVGSFEIFYASNMFFSDLANGSSGIHDIYFIASFPALFIGFDFVLAVLYLSRRILKPEAKHIHDMLYAILLAFNSCVGSVTSILSGTIVYGSFVKPYPFPYYTVISLVLHAVLLAAAVIAAFKASKLTKSSNYRKVNVVYVIHMGVLAAFTFLAFNRFGALLWTPCYVQVRTLDLTLPFYLWLLIPIGLLAHAALYMAGFFRKHQMLGVINSMVLFVLNIAFGCISFAIAKGNTQFVSAISPALALERLATMPVDSLIHFIGCLIISVYMVIFSIMYKNGKASTFR